MSAVGEALSGPRETRSLKRVELYYTDPRPDRDSLLCRTWMAGAIMVWPHHYIVGVRVRVGGCTHHRQKVWRS